MDNKKKFEIEFDDDFDAWLAQREQAMKTSQVKKPVQPAKPAQFHPSFIADPF